MIELARWSVPLHLQSPGLLGSNKEIHTEKSDEFTDVK